MRARPWTAIVMLAACGGEATDRPAAEIELDPVLAEAYQLLESGVSVDLEPVVTLDETAEVAFETDAQTKLVVGRDSRKLVGDTSVPPYSSTTMLLVTFSVGARTETSLCTGTLIAPDAVLTAAHCLYNKQEFDGIALKAIVVPGAYLDQAGSQRPLQHVGGVLATSDDFYLPPEYDDSKGYRAALYPYDYAVIRLNRPLGALAGVRPLAIAHDFVGDYARMLAYHADRCERTDNRCAKGKAFAQYASADSVRKVEKDGWFIHGIDTFKGSNIGLAISERIYADIAAWASL